jgi:hypothetical protein
MNHAVSPACLDHGLSQRSICCDLILQSPKKGITVVELSFMFMITSILTFWMI